MTQRQRSTLEFWATKIIWCVWPWEFPRAHFASLHVAGVRDLIHDELNMFCAKKTLQVTSESQTQGQSSPEHSDERSPDAWNSALWFFSSKKLYFLNLVPDWNIRSGRSLRNQPPRCRKSTHKQRSVQRKIFQKRKEQVKKTFSPARSRPGNLATRRWRSPPRPGSRSHRNLQMILTSCYFRRLIRSCLPVVSGSALTTDLKPWPFSFTSLWKLDDKKRKKWGKSANCAQQLLL